MRARILVVEHQDRDLEEITARLKSNGHELFAARDFENGVEAARRHRPRLILCAIARPSRGLDLLFKLRLDASFDQIPIVAVTAYSAERRSLLDLGFSGVIPKPLPDTFASEVETFLRT